MNLDEQTTISPHQRALERCEDQIKWYSWAKRRQRILYQTFQFTAIVLSGLTPVLILWSDLPKTLQALPAAVAAIASGLIGIFQWKENYSRFGYSAEALKSEKIKFETRTTRRYGAKLDDYEALENFVTRIEALIMDEVTDWRSQILEGASESS